MAIDLRAILGDTGKELGERYVHMKLAEHLREEVAKGASSQDVVAQAIIRLRNSDLLQKIHAVIGTNALKLSLTGLGSFVANTVARMDFDGIASDDQSNLMREARIVLRGVASILPAIIVGGIDGATDTWEKNVYEAVAKIRSNDQATVPQKRGERDVVAYMKPNGSEPADIFFYEGDPSQTDSLELPCCLGSKFQRIKQERIAGVKRTKTVTIPGQKQKDGKEGPSRTSEVDLSDEEYKKACQLALNIEPLPIGEAIRRLDFRGIDPTTVDLLMKRTEPKDPPPPKKEGMIALDEHGLPFTFNVSRTLQKLKEKEHKRQLLRDFIQDIKTNAAYINMLGKEFNVKAVDGCFDEETIETIVQHVQTWMGATLTLENKIRQALARAKHVLEGTTDPMGKRVESAIGEVAGAAGKIALESLFGLTTLFVMFLAIVLLGAFGVSLDRPLAVSWVDGLYFVPTILYLVLGFALIEKGWLRFLFVVLAIASGIPALIILVADVAGRLTPTEFAVALVAGGGILACIELFSFTTFQALLSLVTRFLPNLHKDWLVNKGRILVMFIAIHAGIFMILLAVKTPWLLRLLICVPTFFALGSQMGLGAYEFNEEVRQNAAKTMRLFRVLTILVFIAVAAVLVGYLLDTSLNGVLEWIAGSRIIRSVLIFVGVGYLAWKAVRRSEEKSRTTKAGVVTEILYKPNPNWWVRGIAFILVLGLALWPWIGSGINAHFEQKAPSRSRHRAAATVLTPASPQIIPSVAQPIVPEQIPVKRSVPKRQKEFFMSAEECARHTYEWQKDFGCN